jgi:hypothetical protein
MKEFLLNLSTIGACALKKFCQPSSRVLDPKKYGAMILEKKSKLQAL